MRKYLFSITAAILIFTLLSVYLIYTHNSYNLYLANKTLADTAAIILGLILLIGLTSRLFSFPDRFIQYRKESGIISFFLALFHGIISLFFLRDYFPLSRFFGQVNFPDGYLVN